MTDQYLENLSLIKTPIQEGHRMEVDFTYVIYLVDGVGGEYFISQDDEMVRADEENNPKPLWVNSLSQINGQLNRLRPKFPTNYLLFALERTEFELRVSQIKSEEDG